jgi:tRNA(Ile2) C34 agmatinyltransferase TiaS
LFVSALELLIESGRCPCQGELERVGEGWKCTRCGWEIVEVSRDA